VALHVARRILDPDAGATDRHISTRRESPVLCDDVPFIASLVLPTVIVTLTLCARDAAGGAQTPTRAHAPSGTGGRRVLRLSVRECEAPLRAVSTLLAGTWGVPAIQLFSKLLPR
jgi:hypothetical protein